MTYEWNIAKYDKEAPQSAKYGRHYARITRDTHTPELREAFLAQLRLAFPIEDYNITVSLVQKVGTQIDLGE